MTLIAIVEDETEIAAVLAAYLEREGYTTRRLATGAEAERWLRGANPDLILLDLMLPGIDGLTLCRRIRQAKSVPVIIVTARVEEIDRLLGLELGADDYICKPFSPREVVARVKAVLRRAARADDADAPAAPHAASAPQALSIDADAFTARLHGARLDLTPAEFRLLQTLAKRSGHVLSRTQLLDAISDPSREIYERAVDSHIKNLRRKLAKAGGRDLIESIYGVGYRLDTQE